MIVNINNNTEVAQGALYLASLGWHIFPCKKDKTPYTPNGFYDATTDVGRIEKWWKRFPGALIGSYMRGSDLFAIDVDNKHGKNGSEAWTQLVETYGNSDNVEVGPIQKTENGGFHYIFNHPDYDISSKVNKLGEGLDLRSQAYIIVSPTPGYEWLPDHGPNTPLTNLPTWLFKLIKELHEVNPTDSDPVESTHADGLKWLTQAIERGLPGQRNDVGFWAACQMRDDGFSREETESILMEYQTAVPNPPGDLYTPKDVRATVKSAFNRPPREPAKNASAGLLVSPTKRDESSKTHPSKEAGDKKPVFGISDLNDTGNAARLAKQHGDVMRWVDEWGWLTWDGKRWELDKRRRAFSFAKQTAKSIYREAESTEDDNHAKALAGWANSSLSRYRLESMLKTAADELSARPEDFDQDPLVLNVQNGLLDLETGKLYPHDTNYMVTKIAGAIYDPDAQCPTWKAFLNRVLDNDQELAEYLQRAAGYSLTGDVSEQCLFFLHGSGANGKSTGIQALMYSLGDYGTQAAPNLLMMGKRHPTEIADLQGRRFVATVEVEEGRRLAEVLTKQLTGGDRIKARFMRRDFFEFEPSFKLWLSANHKPIIRGTDYAIWRRIRLIPFEVVIPKDERDPHMLDKLRQELPGILAWAVRGCIAWQREGLPTPLKIEQATSNYRGEMDLLSGFIEECCIVGNQYEAGATVLYKAFTEYCERNGERPWAQRVFGTRLGERPEGFSRKKKMTGIIWYGLGLVDAEV